MSEWDCEHGRTFDLCHECLNKEARTFRQLHHEATQRIRELEADVKLAVSSCAAQKSRADRLEAENARLIKAIKRAPCPGGPYWPVATPGCMSPAVGCDCWKRTVLEDKS